MRYKCHNPKKKDTIIYDRDMCLSKVEWEKKKEELYKERGEKGQHHCGVGSRQSVEDSARYSHGAAATAWERAASEVGKSWIDPKVIRRLIKKAEDLSQNAREADLRYHECMVEFEKMKAKRAARSNPGNPVAFSRSTDVQTLLFPKDRFTAASARAWAERHDFRAGKVDSGSATATRLRVRQREPSAFQKGSFRTIILDHARGVEAVIGKPVVRRNPDMKKGSGWKKVTDYKGHTVWSRVVQGQNVEVRLDQGSKTYGLYVNGRWKGSEPKHEQGLAWAKQAVTEYAKDEKARKVR